MMKERQKLTFSSIIQDILTREVSQPILHTDRRHEPSPKECLETLSSACVRLRGEYVRRLARAAAALADKLRAVHTLAERQRGWLHALQKEIDDVQLQSVVLEEKRLLAEKHQDDIKYRCSAVVRGLRASCRASPAERELLAELHTYKRCRERFADQIQQLKQHSKRNAEEINKWQEEYKKKDAALGKTHSDSIQSILQQQTLQVSTLIEETKLLKDQLSIV
ncbi:nucleoporin 88-like [Manduca sexta]|nr:nucleoporin 88-like [Manduca sexta]